MKKFFVSVIVAVIAMCLSISALASTSSITVKNNVVTEKPVTYNYETGSEGEKSISIRSLMDKLDELENKGSVVQTITVTSDITDYKPVGLKLRLSIPQKENSESTLSPIDYSALDYYNIKVTDTSGAVLYSYEEEQELEIGATYKDIPIGKMNTMRNAETKIFNITISVNDELNKSEIIKSAKTLDWSIVLDTAIEPTAAPTSAPSVSPVSPTPLATMSVSLKEDKNGVVTVQTGEYECGKDFDEGIYTATSNGKLTIYTKAGKVKTTVLLKTPESNAVGVEKYVIQIQKGEKIAVESETKLTPYIAPKATATPKATSTTSKATTAPKSSTTEKNNPKTGDNMPVGGIAMLGIFAVAISACIEIKKRKNN